MKRKLDKVKQTLDYKRYELVTKKDAKWLKVDKNKALQSIQKRFKSTVKDEQSAFSNYANSYSVSNLKLQGIKALSNLKYQDFKLKEYLRKNLGMKLSAITFATLTKSNGEEVELEIPSRRYEITNEEEIPKYWIQVATDIEIQIDKMEVSASGFFLRKIINKLVFHYDKYNSTRGGSFIELPKWVQTKKACINIKNEDDLRFQYSIQCGVHKIYEKDHACKVSHYKNIDDNLNWEGVKFAPSNIDIDRLEENDEGLISVNVYHISQELDDNTILLYRKTSVGRSKFHIDLLKLEEGNKSHYV